MATSAFFQSRGVTRLCHFTKLKDLTHIFSSGAICATASLDKDIKDQKDSGRYDGKTDYVCCSVEYPNTWYLTKAQARDTDLIFKEWVVICIDLAILDTRQTKFSPCNAATGYGQHIFDDTTYLSRLYATPNVLGRRRTINMLSSCPTDDQAEVLIKDDIPCHYFAGFVTGSDELAERVYAMLKLYDMPPLPIYVAPEVMDTRWSKIVRNGERPHERLVAFEQGE